MPSPIGNLVPLCGAHSKRSGMGCRNRAMPNGRCRMHGGKSTGPPAGSTNAITHGIYSTAITLAERELWDRIDLGTLDDEIKIAKLRLARVLRQEQLYLAAENDADRTKLLELTKTSSTSERGGKGGTKQGAIVERSRPDFHRLALNYMRRIAELENTRRILNDDGGPHGPLVQLIIEGG
jgi:hypothetical protein